MTDTYVLIVHCPQDIIIDPARQAALFDVLTGACVVEANATLLLDMAVVCASIE